MSFGKDDRHLDNIPGFGGATFGQQAAAASARPQRREGKTPYWRNNFDLSENPARQDVFRILRGSYRQQIVQEGTLVEEVFPFVIFREHYHGSLQKGAICSAGPFYLDRERRQPCEGCAIHWEDWEIRRDKKNRGDNSRGPNRISMTDKYGFSVWDYAYYFEMPQVDQSGQYRMNPRTNQPYTEWTKAANPQDPQFAGKKWKQGDLRPWAVGKTWKETLVNWNVSIGTCCVKCGARGSVQSRGWYCGNPQCRQLIFDPNNTTMPEEQQAEVTKQPYHCAHCGQRSLMHEEVFCAQCGQGQRASIFDVDLYGFRQRSGDGNQTQLIITGHSEPRAIQVTDPNVLKDIKPLDLLKHYAPTPVDVQRKLWNITGQATTPSTAQWAPPPSGVQPAAAGAYPIPTVNMYPQPPPGVAPPTVGYPQPATGDINAQLAALSQTLGGNNK